MNNIEFEKRIDLFKNTLSSSLNARYYQGSDINNLKERFALYNNELKKTQRINALVGVIDGYEYCLLEYYSNNFDFDSFNEPKLKLLVSVVIHNRNFPEFKLVAKWPWGIIINILIVLLSALFPIFLFFLFFILVMRIVLTFIHPTEMLENMTMFEFIIHTIKYLFFLAFLYIPSHFCFKSISKIIESLFQWRYGIKNEEFNRRYEFSDVKDIVSVKKVFTPEVCEKVVSFVPFITGINSKGNCLLFTTNGIINNTESCVKFMEAIIGEAKIFSQKY